MSGGDRKHLGDRYDEMKERVRKKPQEAETAYISRFFGLTNDKALNRGNDGTQCLPLCPVKGFTPESCKDFAGDRMCFNSVLLTDPIHI